MRGRYKKLIIGAAATVGATACGLMAADIASAQAGPSEVEVLGTQLNLLWVVIGAVLVIFMQAGFALVETGFCRAKHAAHVVSTNFAMLGISTGPLGKITITDNDLIEKSNPEWEDLTASLV